MPPKTITTRIDYGALAYRVVSTLGPTDQLPVVLVHGIGMSHRYFRRLQPTLAADRTVVSIDLPGHGGLPTPGMDAGIPAIAEGLGEAIAALGLGPVVLFGHSMGAQWVLELALRRPELIAGVVVAGPVTDDRHRTLTRQATALGLDTLLEPPRANLIVFSDYLRCGVPWYLTQVRHMLGYPTDERAEGLAMPLLVIRGGRDPIAGQEWCRRLSDAAPRGTFVDVPGGAHVVQYSETDAVAEVVRVFAADLDGEPRWL